MTSNTENQNEAATETTNEVVPLISPKAGIMRGARLWPDPDGILEGPFTEDGVKMGYVLVYGEEEPAVFDGKVWHPVLNVDRDWYGMQDEIAQQYYKVVDHAKQNPAYEELAKYITGGGTF